MTFSFPKTKVVAVTEFVSGGDLNRVLAGSKGGGGEGAGGVRLTYAQVRRIAGDLMSALHYMHARRVLHRDLKPANVLLDDKEGGRVKVCDFGFAR